MSASLIEKLLALKKQPSPNALEMMVRQEINNALNDAIAVVREHEADQPNASAGVVQMLEGIRSLCTVRYQAYQYCKEGEPGYVECGEMAVDVTAYIGKVRDYLDRAIAALQAAPVAEQQVTVLPTPTERMCDGARGFIMGLDMDCRTWAAMEEHLDAGNYDCLPSIRQKAKESPQEHITRWEVAECIWQLMQRYHPIAAPSMADGSATISPVAAEPRCPECGYTKQDALIHWDHWRCKGRIPGFDPEPVTGETIPQPTSGSEAEEAFSIVHEALRLTNIEMSHLKHQRVFREGGSVDFAWTMVKKAIAALPALNPTPKDTALQVAVEVLRFYAGDDSEDWQRWLKRMNNDLGENAINAAAQINTILKGEGKP